MGTFTKIDFARSTLCIIRDTYPQIWNEGQNYCYQIYAGASLCRHEQIRRACSNGGAVLTAGSWLADRSADGQAFFVNLSNCNDFDGVSPVAAALSGAYCCLEWMKY